MVQLRPAQRVLCKVAFDGWEPRDLDADERVLALELFGEVEEIPAIARAVLAVIIGGRAGKTYLFSLRVLHLALTHPLTTLAPGEHGIGLLMAPDLDLAKQALRYCSGAVNAHEELRQMVRSDTAEALTLERYDGQIVTISCRAAARGGRGGRGKSLFAVLMDEACFFRDSNYAVNDEEVYKAASPRVMEGGQTLIPSTPWMESGLLYDMWSKNHPARGGTPTFALAAHAKTLTMRPEMADVVARERERDPGNAAREFDAEPMGGGAVHFFDPAALKACISDDMPAIVARRTPFERAWMGLDTGFRKNPSGGVVVRDTGTVLETAECAEITPPKGGRLVPSETLKALVARAKFHHCEALVADQHYIETVREHASGLTLIEAPTVPADAYTVARDAVAEGRVRISAQHTRLISQLREVVSRPTSGGNISISSPTRGTAHGDVASAWVLAMWKAASGGVGMVKGQAARTAVTNLLDESTAGVRREHSFDGERQVRQRKARGPFG